MLLVVCCVVGFVCDWVWWVFGGVSDLIVWCVLDWRVCWGFGGLRCDVEMM